MVQWAVEGETATPVENRQMLSSIWSRPPDPKQPPSQIAPTIVLYSVLLVWFVCLCATALVLADLCWYYVHVQMCGQD